MTQNNPQLPWTDEQWDRVQQVVCEEARKARVAASFLPIVGPLPPDTDYVSKDALGYEPEPVQPKPPDERMIVEDKVTQSLSTLQIQVYLRGPQVADPELTSALQMFRRAANVLARLEDAIIFNGRAAKAPAPRSGHEHLPKIWKILADGALGDRGLYEAAPTPTVAEGTERSPGNDLVSQISGAIGELEARGHLGPFACVLDQEFFREVQTSNPSSLVLPQDRILPFLGGGPLLRSSALAKKTGVVIALGGAPIDLVLAKDISVSFLQVTLEPRFVFRVYEKLTLRIKEQGAIRKL
jgi:uncharacterized linocin/CFP29 family protein